MALRHVLLGLLATRPSHPYELKRRISPGLPPDRLVNDGVLYPLLARLERERLVAKREEVTPAGRVRHVFETTEEGRRDLLAWLADPEVDTGGIAHDALVGHPLGKLLFVDRLPRAQRRALLDAALSRAVDAVAALEALRAAPTPDLESPYGRALLDLLLAQRRAEVDVLTRLAAATPQRGVTGRSKPPS